MTTFTNAQEAAETGTNTLITAEVTLKDVSTVNSSAWHSALSSHYGASLQDFTLYIKKVGNSTLRDSSDSTWWHGCVKRWGTIREAGDYGRAFGSRKSVNITMSNLAYPEHIAIGSGVHAAPVPDGDRQKLHDLFHIFLATGQPIVIRQYYFPTSSTDLNLGTHEVVTLFSGVIQGVGDIEADGDSFSLRCRDDEGALNQPIPNNRIDRDDTYDSAAAYYPICYGEYKTGSEFPVNALDSLNNLALGLVPDVAPAVNCGLENDTEICFAVSDYRGENDGDQTYWANADGSPSGFDDLFDHIVRYHPEVRAYTRLRMNHSSPTRGDAFWKDNTAGSNKNDVLQFNIEKYPRGYLYLPCNFLADSGSGVTNPHESGDRDPSTYATLDMTSTSGWVEWDIPEIAPPGHLILENASISPYLIFATGSSITSGTLRFGLYENGSGGAGFWTTPGTSYDDISTGWASHLTAGNYFATVNYNAWQGSNIENWNYTLNSQIGRRVILRAKVQTAGVGDLRIAGTGIRMYYDMYRGSLQVRKPRTRVSVGGRKIGVVPGETVDTREFPDTALYAVPEETTLDTASGTISGTNNKLLTNPMEQACHLIYRWARDVTTGEIDITSFRDAGDDLDDWIDADWETGEDFKSLIRVVNQTTLHDVLAAICEQTPCIIHRDLDGTFYAYTYPRTQTQIDALRFEDSGGTDVKFHPNFLGGDTGEFPNKGKPYGAKLRAYQTELDDVLTSVSVNFKYHWPSGNFTDFAEVGASARYWAVGSSSWQGLTNSFINITPFPPRGRDIDADILYHPWSASLLAMWIAKRHSYPRMRVEIMTGMEAVGARIGQTTKLSNEFHAQMQMIELGVHDFEDREFYFVGKEIDLDAEMVTLSAEIVRAVSNEPATGN